MDPDKDMQVNVDDGMLTIHAERREEKTAHGRPEFAYGSFDRSVRLSRNADSEHITDRYDNGVLAVTVLLTEPQPTGMKIRSKA